MTILRWPWRPAALFVVLSGADLALTCHLVNQPESGVYEANGLAASVLDRYGCAGLAAYKGVVVLLAAALIGLVAHYRPAAGRRLTRFACAAVACVVLYSVALCGQVAWLAAADEDSRLATARQQQSLEELGRRRHAFRVTLEKREKDLAAGRCELPQAVAALLPLDEARRLGAFVVWYRGDGASCSEKEGVAALVLHRTLDILNRDGSPAAQARAAQLLSAYRSTYSPALLGYVTDVYAGSGIAPGTEREPAAVAPRRGPSRYFGRPHGRPRYAPGHYARGRRPNVARAALPRGARGGTSRAAHFLPRGSSGICVMSSPLAPR